VQGAYDKLICQVKRIDRKLESVYNILDATQPVMDWPAWLIADQLRTVVDELRNLCDVVEQLASQVVVMKHAGRGEDAK